MNIGELASRVEAIYDSQNFKSSSDVEEIFSQFMQALNLGLIRIAEKVENEWNINHWVKKGILIGFKIGKLIDTSINENFVFYDKNTYPLKKISLNDNIRIVPGGSSIRDGSFVSPGVVCMPPMYINVGAYVDQGTMIDSHALVGSCAQIGKRVHISAAAQIGGVLEPISARPVIIEDDVLIGGNCGIYEGTLIRQKAVIAAGTILTGSTPVYDLVNEKVCRKEGDTHLEIPEGAVLIPGCRSISRGWGQKNGLSIQTPLIVKYRDSSTSKSIELEDLLR